MSLHFDAAPYGAQCWGDKGQNRESGRKTSILGRLGFRAGSETTPYATEEQGDREPTGSGPSA